MKLRSDIWKSKSSVLAISDPRLWVCNLSEDSLCFKKTSPSWMEKDYRLTKFLPKIPKSERMRKQPAQVCERFMGSIRRECLNHILIQDDRHLERVTKEYTTYFNQERPHQGIDQRIPNQYDLTRSKPTSGRITSKAILGGLHHSYSRTMYLN